MIWEPGSTVPESGEYACWDVEGVFVGWLTWEAGQTFEPRGPAVYYALEWDPGEDGFPRPMTDEQLGTPPLEAPYPESVIWDEVQNLQDPVTVNIEGLSPDRSTYALPGGKDTPLWELTSS